LLFAADMNGRRVAIWLLLGALGTGCRTSDAGLIVDGGGGVDGEAETPQRPAPPPIIPNLDATAAPDPVPEDDAGTATATEAGRPADAGGIALPDAAATPAPVDARPAPDLAAPADTAPATVVPDGCGMVSCDGVGTRRDCCRGWYFFALESEDRNQMQRDGLVTSFSKGADVRATYAFDRAGQDGAVGMLLDRLRRLTAIRVTSQFGGAAAPPPYVTTEGANGGSGCAYPLAPGGLADMGRPLFCWGNRAVMPDRINVRIEAKGPGPANIRVTAMEVR
jgi:hypothetical protein